MIHQNFKVYRVYVLPFFSSIKSWFYQKYHYDQCNNKNGYKPHYILYFVWTFIALSIRVFRIPRFTRSTQNSSIMFLTISLWMKIGFWFWTKAGFRSYAFYEYIRIFIFSPVTWFRTYFGTSKTYCLLLWTYLAYSRFELLLY